MDENVSVHAMVSVTPIGVGVSLSSYIAECERVFYEEGLKVQLHAHGTNLEGPWGRVRRAIERAIARVHALGAPRVSTWIKLSTRTDRAQTMEEMVESVRRKLEVEVS